MKICVVAYKFGTEKEIGEHLGIYHYFIEKMRRLLRFGHEVTVVAPYINFFKKGSENVDGIKITRYWPPMIASIWAWPFNRIIRILYIQRTQRRVLQTVKNGCELVYVWQARETGYAVAKIRHKLRVPFIFRQITAWHWHFKRTTREIFIRKSWYRILRGIGLGKITDMKLEFLLGKKSQMKYAKTIYEKADKIIFLSRAAIQEGKELGLDVSKAVDLGVAIDDDAFRPMDNKNELRRKLGIRGGKVILFIGRINFDEKGIGYLIDAMPEIILKIEDVALVIVGGGGESEKMNAVIKKLGMEKYIQIFGKRPFAELPEIINSSDVFVVPSLWMEAFGKVTIEAMSCAVPVVTSDAGASPEINIDGKTGFVVPAGNSEALAHAIMKVLSDPIQAKNMGQAARRRVLENYTYDTIIKKFLDIISTV